MGGLGSLRGYRHLRKRTGGRRKGMLASYFAESLRELWQRPAQQVPALDAIRAVAVLAVILSHIRSFWTEHVPAWPEPAMLDGLVFLYGWTGVDLFFILSGYLIGRQLWKEKQARGTVDVGEFFMRRGLRIWPLYFAIMLLGFASGTFQPVLADLLFYSNYATTGYTRGWTLSTEEQFYVAVPLLLLFTPGIKRLGWYFPMLGGVVVSVWMLRYYTCHSILMLEPAACKDVMVFPIHLHNESLVAGLAIALFAVLHPHYFERRPDAGLSKRGLAVMLACCSLALVLYRFDSMVFSTTAIALIFGSVALWLLWDRSVLSWPATWRIWYPVSRLSYGMYLNHLIFLPGTIAWGVVWATELTGSVTVGGYVAILVGIAVSMGLATVTFVLVERPFLLLRAHWLASRRGSRIVAHDPQVLPRFSARPTPTGMG